MQTITGMGGFSGSGGSGSHRFFVTTSEFRSEPAPNFNEIGSEPRLHHTEIESEPEPALNLVAIKPNFTEVGSVGLFNAITVVGHRAKIVI